MSFSVEKQHPKKLGKIEIFVQKDELKIKINMGCCSNGRGCKIHGNAEGSVSCKSGCNKLDVYNWLGDLPPAPSDTDWVEVRFKNTRKAYYQNNNALKLEKGDVVAVEANPGHDIGVISLTGNLVIKQMQKNGVQRSDEPKKIYRKAKPVDIEKWEAAMAREQEVMLETRRICRQLQLDMKVSDVEFQGDNTKAIFYYIAQNRVDFRELIKILAERFRIRVEMKQIGARQEAGLVGGLGSCGRELCCSTFVTKFVTVTTGAARYQELSLNPQKLAGQCGKLKCCLNYELDSYIDAQKDFPNTNISLEAENGTAYHFKTDIFNSILYYSSSPDLPANIVALSVERVKEIIRLNKQGIKVRTLHDTTREVPQKREISFANDTNEDDINRFSQKDNRDRRKKRPNRPERGERQEKPEKTERNDAPERVENQAAPDGQTPQRNNPDERKQSENNQRRDNRQRDNQRRDNRQRDNRDRNQNRDNRDNRQERNENRAERNENKSENRSEKNDSVENRNERTEPRQERQENTENRQENRNNRNRKDRFDNRRRPEQRNEQRQEAKPEPSNQSNERTDNQQTTQQVEQDAPKHDRPQRFQKNRRPNRKFDRKPRPQNGQEGQQEQ